MEKPREINGKNTMRTNTNTGPHFKFMYKNR